MQPLQNKPRLVFLSGLLCDGFVWDEIQKTFATSYATHVIHFAGFNSLQAMASHTLDQFSGSAVIIGHSMGGRVALEVFRQAPNRVMALGLLNTGVHTRGANEALGRLEILLTGAQYGMDAVAKAWLPPMLSPSVFDDKGLIEGLEAMVKRHSLSDFAAQIHALIHRPEVESLLPDITIPTWIASGTHDTWSPLQQHQEIHRKIPHSELEELIDLGHMSIVENPAYVGHVLALWLQRIGM